MSRVSFLLLLILFGFLTCCSSAPLESSVPDENLEELSTLGDSISLLPIGFVNDFEGVFTLDERDLLESRLLAYESATTREIAIVTVASIEPFAEFEDFALALSKNWGVGKKELNNGLTIVFSMELREIRISTGSGTEKILNDEICEAVLNEIIIPAFRKEQYFEGISRALDTLLDKWIN